MADLDKLLKEAAEKVKRMSPEERAAMIEAQRRSWVRGEMDWPKPKRHRGPGGEIVYAKYEDYCNG